MKGVIKNMKEQFLNLSGLTELVTYIKLCIAQHKMIIPRASFSLFPKTGDENNIYIDTSTNSIYRWNDSDKSFVLLAKPPRNISISEGKNNGQITLKVDEIESNATVHGLKSAAFSNASSFATSAQGAKADSAIQSITIAPGTNNGTVKITVNGVTTDNIKVAGLGSAAFSDIAVFAPAKHTHSKSDVGLGNVDNTADIDKSVKYAGSSGSSNTVVYTALTNTDLNTLQTEGKWYYAGGGNTCTNVPVESAAFELYVGRNASGWRYQQFTVTSGEIYIRVFDSSNWGNWRKLAFTSDTVTAASSVPWSGITGKPSTFAPSSHNHTIANITDIGKASVNFANSAGCPQGFSSRTTTATWGNQTGTVVTDWHTSNGGDIAFRDNSGQLNVVIDGFFYQNEGKNLVLDSGNYSNYAATKIHTHTISNITNLQTTLDGKSNTNHTHDLNQMINTLTNGTSDPADTDYYIAQYAGGGSTTTTYHRRPHSALWNYIKSKANSVYQPKGSYAASSHTHDDRYYTETEINTKLGAKLGAVSANGYYGMARPDGNTSDWIRTTTAGIIPYQSGGAGAGHCGLGTSSWYFSNAYIDTVNCVNTNASGLISTSSEYRSCKGGEVNRDWRFGSATGSGDQNWFGFYDYTYGYHGGIYGPGHSLRMGGEIQSTAANGFRAVQGKYGFIIRNDGANVYFMMTGNGDPWGGWNDNYTIFTPNGEWQVKKSPYDNGMSTARGYVVVSDSNNNRVYSISNYNANYLKVRCGLSTYHCTYSNSDIRLKKNINNTSITNALSVINSIKVRQFDWKETNIHQSIGFVADELEKLDPNFSQGGGVTKDGGIDVKSVNSFYLQGYIVKALQELSSQVSDLKQENKRLKQKLNMCN